MNLHISTYSFFFQITFLFIAMSVFSGCGSRQQSLNNSTTQSHHLKDNGLKALNYRDFSRANIIADSLLELGEEDPGNIEAKLYGKIIKGQASMYTGDFEESYPSLHEAVALCLNHRNDSALASAYNGLGIYSMNVEKDNNEALRYFFLGIDAAKRSGSERLHSLLLCNVAAVYYLTRNPMGLRYGMECYNRGKVMKDEYLRLIGSMTVAFSHMARGEYEQALTFIKEAEVVMRSYDIKEGATLYCLYGMILRRMGKNEEAEKAFQESIDFYSSGADDMGDIRSFTELGEMLAEEGKYSQALDILESGLKNYQQGHEVTFRGELLAALARVNRLAGNISKADEYEQLRISETDSVQNHEKEIAIAQLRSKYDLERVENEINRQRVEILEKRNQIYILFLIVGLGLSLLISVIILYRHKSRLYSAIVRQMTDSVREETRLRETLRELEAKLRSSSSDNAIIGNADPTDSEPSCEDQDSPCEADTEPQDESETDLTSDRDAEDDTCQESGTIPPKLYKRLQADMESVLSDPVIFTDNLLNKDRLARKLGTNRTYLSRFINAHYKMSFTQLINSMRIKEAIRILSDPDINIPLKSVADQVGFNSQTTFYSNFVATTGMTPAAFRARARNMSSR